MIRPISISLVQSFLPNPTQILRVPISHYFDQPSRAAALIYFIVRPISSSPRFSPCRTYPRCLRFRLLLFCQFIFTSP